MNICPWPLGNGQSLYFHVCKPNTRFASVAGLYIFAYLDRNSSWHALYIGQTTDFSSRLCNHERWHEAIRNGASHIHVLHVPLAATRDAWERQLIRILRPPLNDQWKPYPYIFGWLK